MDKLQALFEAGYYVGLRHEHRNTAFTGKFMVAENGNIAKVTEHAGECGGFCIVGDNLRYLIEEASIHLESIN